MNKKYKNCVFNSILELLITVLIPFLVFLVFYHITR